MKTTFEYAYEEVIFRNSIGQVVLSGNLMVMEPDDAAILDLFLNSFGLSTDEFLLTLTRPLDDAGLKPGAIALLGREFRLAGHLMSVRRNRTDFLLSSYSQVKKLCDPAVHGPPPVSFLVINNREAILKGADKSPLLLNVWEGLMDLPASRNWAFITASPPEWWVRETETMDDELFWKVRGERN